MLTNLPCAKPFPQPCGMNQKDRIRSYWHCYHSRRYPDWQSYPVRLLAEEIDKEIARIVFRRPLTPNVV